MYVQIGAINEATDDEPRTPEQLAFLEAEHDPDALVEILDGDASLVRDFDRHELIPPTASAVLALLHEGQEIVCRGDWDLLEALRDAGIRSRPGFWGGERILSLEA